eukprot:7391567-Prymnesium_polylepis.5
MSDASSSEWMLARWPPILTQYASASAKFLLSLKNWNVGSGSFGGGGGGEGHGCCGGSGGGGGETLGSRTIAALQPEVLPQRCIHSCSPETRVGLPMGSSHVAAVQMRLKVDSRRQRARRGTASFGRRIGLTRDSSTCHPSESRPAPAPCPRESQPGRHSVAPSCPGRLTMWTQRKRKAGASSSRFWPKSRCRFRSTRNQ